MTTDTPANVAASATQAGMLILDNLTVIGVFMGTDAPAALVRSRSGEIARVHPGEIVFGVAIGAIEGTNVVLTDSAGTRHVLTVPGS